LNSFFAFLQKTYILNLIYETFRKNTNYYANKMSYNAAKFCSHCKSTGKTYPEYTSHYVRNQTTSCLTCPDLLKRVCKNCPIKNHTWDRCPLSQKPFDKPAVHKPAILLAPAFNKPSVKKPIAPANKNRFSCLDDDEEDAFVFDQRQIMGISHQHQINCLGEEIYKRVLIKEPKRAGMITAMLLEIIIPDLVTMLNTQEMFDSLVADSVDVLQTVATI
jgi:hypothetical protein